MNIKPSLVWELSTELLSVMTEERYTWMDEFTPKRRGKNTSDIGQEQYQDRNIRSHQEYVIINKLMKTKIQSHPIFINQNTTIQVFFCEM